MVEKKETQLTPFDKFKVHVHKQYSAAITNYFRGNKKNALRFMSAMQQSVQKTPKLLECTPDSLMNAFMACAEYELYPSNVTGEAHVLPYNNKGGMVAQFKLGYQGVVKLAQRAGAEKVTATIVHANDFFDYEEGTDPKLVHKPVVFGDRGEPIGVYAIAVVNGHNIFKVLSKEAVLKFKEFSKSKTSEYSPWNPANDPELWMWKKTAIKQLGKLLPNEGKLHEAIAKDNQEDSTLPILQLDAASPAVGKADHKPVVSEAAPEEDTTESDDNKPSDQ